MADSSTGSGIIQNYLGASCNARNKKVLKNKIGLCERNTGTN